MKIGILTFHFSHNVGSALQAYALRQYLQAMSKDVVCDVINYEKKDWITPPHLNNCKSSVYIFIAQYVVYFLVKVRIAIFKKFQRQYCGLTKRIKKEDLPNLNSQYDMFVFGGDQIWCVENSKVDDTYFGDFINDNRKKISYAPSFGITHLPGTYKEKIAYYLGKFKAISVREKSGQEIIKEILRIEPSIVLDPVFLIGKEYYDKLATKTKEKDNFCLCYIRDKSYGIAIDTAKELTERYHLKMMTLSGTDLNGSRFPIVGPESWLSLIKSAKIIVTNSFHAVCFSIIYHKEFYVDANQNATRIINILKMLGLEDRILPINKIYDAKPIDWNRVDKIIECECQKSKQYLKEAIFS